MIGDGDIGESNFGDHPPNIRIGVSEAAHDFEDTTVVESKTGDVLQQWDIRNGRDDFVVRASDEEKQWRFFAGLLLTNNARRTFSPFVEERRNQFRGILQIGGHGDYAVAGTFEQSMKRGPNMSEISTVLDHGDSTVAISDGFEFDECVIGGAVVDEQKSEGAVRYLGDHRTDSVVEFVDIQSFVVAGKHEPDVKGAMNISGGVRVSWFCAC